MSKITTGTYKLSSGTTIKVQRFYTDRKGTKRADIERNNTPVSVRTDWLEKWMELNRAVKQTN